MKLLSMTTALLCLAASLGAQGNVQPYPAAQVTGVEPTMAFEPGSIAILGKNLDLTLEVRINGYPVPIVRNTGHRIVIEPRPQIPGLAKLELVQPRGLVLAELEFMPSLHADSMGGGRLSAGLHPGQRGFYVLYYSSTRGATPFHPTPVYYHSMLDLTVPHSGMLGMGLSDGAPFHVVEAMPLVMVGRPLHVQALCWYPTASGLLGSYSNVVSTTM